MYSQQTTPKGGVSQAQPQLTEPDMAFCFFSRSLSRWLPRDMFATRFLLMVVEYKSGCFDCAVEDRSSGAVSAEEGG